MPLGGVVVARRIAEPFWESGGAMFRHGPTYSAHPTCCAAAMANLDIMRRENLLQRGMELEGEIAGALRTLEGRDLVGDVRAGIGALGAVAFDTDALAAHPDLPQRVFAPARARGGRPRRPRPRPPRPGPCRSAFSRGRGRGGCSSAPSATASRSPR